MQLKIALGPYLADCSSNDPDCRFDLSTVLLYVAAINHAAGLPRYKCFAGALNHGAKTDALARKH